MIVTLYTFYHGTTLSDALDIVQHGLDPKKLLALQTRPTQLGKGFYATFEPDIAWFFASLVAETFDDHCAIVEITISQNKLEYLLNVDQARIEPIHNVPFMGKQVWFALESFDYLNQHATFIPYQGD